MTSRGVIPESVFPPPSEVTDAPDEKQRARARVGMTIKNKWRLDALLGVGGMASVSSSASFAYWSRMWLSCPSSRASSSSVSPRRAR